MTEELLQAARALYEGTHGMSMSELADITGIPKRTLALQARDKDWAKLLETKHGGQTEAAAAALELFRNRAAEVVEQKAETNEALKVLAEVVPGERDEVLARHRKEWSAPRALAAEATRMRETDPIKAMERAKLGKILAETLKLTQDGERKAFGIDVGELPAGQVVVIERA